jgi:uncharacterized membrane protein
MSSIASGGDGRARVRAPMAPPTRTQRSGRIASRALSTLMVAWAIGVPLAPLGFSAGGGVAAGSAIVYAAGSLVCHQRPERSFATSGRPWPVCARCAGIYLAAGLVAMAGLVPAVGRALSADAPAWRRRFALALVPVAVTWALERFGLLEVAAPLRAASGAGLGAAVAAAVVSVRARVRPEAREDLR